jgi:hypothetical protein
MQEKIEQKEDNLWKQILQKASKEKFNIPSKTVLMVGKNKIIKKKKKNFFFAQKIIKIYSINFNNSIGDKGTGKASLITRIHSLDFEDSLTKGMGLDYSYGDTYDESKGKKWQKK